MRDCQHIPGPAEDWANRQAMEGREVAWAAIGGPSVNATCPLSECDEPAGARCDADNCPGEIETGEPLVAHWHDKWQQAEAARCELEGEIAARIKPPHLDGAYREGIFAGLELALRIIKGEPDVTEDEVHAYPTARVYDADGDAKRAARLVVFRLSVAPPAGGRRFA